MEYLKFVFAVAMIGALIGLFWRALFAEKAIECTSFDHGVEDWQKSFGSRSRKFTSRTVPLDGQKYEFKPPKVSRAKTRRPAAGPPHLKQRFELVG